MGLSCSFCLCCLCLNAPGHGCGTLTRAGSVPWVHTEGKGLSLVPAEEMFLSALGLSGQAHLHPCHSQCPSLEHGPRTRSHGTDLTGPVPLPGTPGLAPAPVPALQKNTTRVCTSKRSHPCSEEPYQQSPQGEGLPVDTTRSIKMVTTVQKDASGQRSTRGWVILPHFRLQGPPLRTPEQNPLFLTVCFQNSLHRPPRWLLS